MEADGLYHGGSTSEQHFDASYLPGDVVIRASDDSASVDVFGEGSEDSPCDVDLTKFM